VGRRRAAGGGARPRREARFLRQLAPDGIVGRAPDRDGTLHGRVVVARGAVSILGMADSFPAQHRASGCRTRHTPEDSRDPGVRADQRDGHRCPSSTRFATIPRACCWS
jgi:hypothetical protein